MSSSVGLKVYSSIPSPSIPLMTGMKGATIDKSCDKKFVKPEKHAVHWFRKGLRLHDNPALRKAIQDAVTLRCVFVIDPWFAGSSNVGINKWRFLLQCLEDLDLSLRKLNSRLFVIRGQPADALPKLFKEWGTTCLTFEEDPEPFGKVRDNNITLMCKEHGIEVIPVVSHTLYKLDHIIEKNGGRSPLTYHQFQAIIASMDPPPPAEQPITSEFIGKTYTPISDDHDEKFNVPSLDELGFDTEGLKPPVWIGGETEALSRLERHLERKAWVASFGRPKMTPQSLLASQTGLSPYLRFGCLSTRLFYHQLTDLYKKIKKAVPPLSLHGQLLWREFFYCAATKNSNFDKMVGNPICVQIPWDKNPEALAKWANGHTGFPWIDAIMTQLREEGWIHHLARHAVACFLTRGDLWISWEEGMKVFDEFLLDADWSVNAGMWMWLSCSSFFQQFFHCYCPVRFGRKADPNGDYIRRYLPVLKNFPTKYIHEPWNAPESVQKSAKCIIGKDYSLPMINHAVASRTNMERMKQVYAQLSKYRPQKDDDAIKGGSAIAGLLEAARSQIFTPYIISSPSPTSVMCSTNDPSQYIHTYQQKSYYHHSQLQKRHIQKPFIPNESNSKIIYENEKNLNIQQQNLVMSTDYQYKNQQRDYHQFQMYHDLSNYLLQPQVNYLYQQKQFERQNNERNYSYIMERPSQPVTALVHQSNESIENQQERNNQQYNRMTIGDDKNFAQDLKINANDETKTEENGEYTTKSALYQKNYFDDNLINSEHKSTITNNIEYNNQYPREDYYQQQQHDSENTSSEVYNKNLLNIYNQEPSFEQ